MCSLVQQKLFVGMCVISSFCSDSSAENTIMKWYVMGAISSIAVGREGKQKKTLKTTKNNQKPQQHRSYSSVIIGKNRLSTSMLFLSSLIPLYFKLYFYFEIDVSSSLVLVCYHAFSQIGQAIYSSSYCLNFILRRRPLKSRGDYMLEGWLNNNNSLVMRHCVTFSLYFFDCHGK